MRILLLIATLLSILTAGALAQTAGGKGDTAKAQALLAQAREALGGEAKLKAIQSLSASGSFRRMLGEREMNGELAFDLLLPDKYKRTEILSPMPGMEMTRIEAVNGEKAWMDSQSSGGGGGMVFIRRPGGDSPHAQAAQANAMRAEFARLLLGWLLTSPASFPLEFTYAGQAEAGDGRADVIDVTGPNNFATRLYLDQSSHLPLMISYLGRAPRFAMQTMSGPPPKPEEIEKRANEAQAEAAATPEVEIQVHFGDYRAVDGVNLPHLISRSINGETKEEWELTKFKLNPPLKPTHFEKK